MLAASADCRNRVTSKTNCTCSYSSEQWLAGEHEWWYQWPPILMSTNCTFNNAGNHSKQQKLPLHTEAEQAKRQLTSDFIYICIYKGQLNKHRTEPNCLASSTACSLQSAAVLQEMRGPSRNSHQDHNTMNILCQLTSSSNRHCMQQTSNTHYEPVRNNECITMRDRLLILQNSPS